MNACVVACVEGVFGHLRKSLQESSQEFAEQQRINPLVTRFNEYAYRKSSFCSLDIAEGNLKFESIGSWADRGLDPCSWKDPKLLTSERTFTFPFQVSFPAHLRLHTAVVNVAT
jgi:hypothetical protein